jgi:hypothetical protein
MNGRLKMSKWVVMDKEGEGEKRYSSTAKE